MKLPKSCETCISAFLSKHGHLLCSKEYCNKYDISFLSSKSPINSSSTTIIDEFISEEEMTL